MFKNTHSPWVNMLSRATCVAFDELEAGTSFISLSVSHKGKQLGTE